MDPRIQQLLDRAFRVVPGGAFNAVRYELTNDPDQRVLVCETVIPPDASWAYVREAVYPPLCRYLKGKKIDPADPQGVVVAVFCGDTCHLLRGTDFMEAFCRAEHIDRARFRSIVSAWIEPPAASPPMVTH